jgi:hypothetical protein
MASRHRSELNRHLDLGRLFLLSLALLTYARAGGAEDDPPTTPPVLNDDQLLRKYVWSSLGPPGAIGAVAVAGFEQWQHFPDEWGQGASGFSKRWASAYAASAIGDTTKYAVAHWTHQDPSFVRCECRGFGPRFRHALISPFMARTKDRRYVFSIGNLAAQTTEHVIPAALWYPERHVVRDGLLLAAGGIAAKIGVNVLHEFVSLPRLPKTP